MDEKQEIVNGLAKALRLEVIEHLVKEDIFKYRGSEMNKEDLKLTIMYIDKLPCCTRKLRRLFEDAHDMHEQKGMMPHCVTIGDLEWCLKKRYIGFRCEQEIKNSWLPYPEDTDLVQLPSFIQLEKVYCEENKVIAPIDTDKIENELMAILYMDDKDMMAEDF